jgi:transposase-like protein
MIRTSIKETIGQYLSWLMDAELTHFLGRKRYERLHGDVNHQNGSYERNFTLKVIGVRLISRFQETARVTLEPMSFHAVNDTKTLFARIYV